MAENNLVKGALGFVREFVTEIFAELVADKFSNRGGEQAAKKAAEKAGKAVTDFVTPQEGRDEWLVMLGDLERTWYGWPQQVPHQTKPDQSRWLSTGGLTQIDPEYAQAAREIWHERLREARERGRENWLVNQVGKVWKSMSDDQTKEPNENRMKRYLIHLSELHDEEFWERVANHHHDPFLEKIQVVGRKINNDALRAAEIIRQRRERRQ